MVRSADGDKMCIRTVQRWTVKRLYGSYYLVAVVDQAK